MDYKTLFSQYSKLEIDTGLIVPLTKVNKVLFGITQDFPILPKLTLINTEIVNPSIKKVPLQPKI